MDSGGMELDMLHCTERSSSCDYLCSLEPFGRSANIFYYNTVLHLIARTHIQTSAASHSIHLRYLAMDGLSKIDLYLERRCNQVCSVQRTSLGGDDDDDDDYDDDGV